MPIAQEKSRYTIKLCVEAGSSPAGVANLKVGGSNPSPATIYNIAPSSNWLGLSPFKAAMRNHAPSARQLH